MDVVERQRGANYSASLEAISSIFLNELPTHRMLNLHAWHCQYGGRVAHLQALQEGLPRVR